MIIIEKCPVCGSSSLKKSKAAIHPFLAERIWDGKVEETTLSECKNCSFVFFNARLSDKETRALYQDYRNQKYQEQRNKYEWWYTKEANESIGKNKYEIINRKVNLGKIIEKNIDFKEIRSVMDFGGDMGQFIPDLLSGTDRCVYEISDVQALKGIKKMTQIKNLKKKFDFVMCCHVIEHVSFPKETVQQIKQLLSNKGYAYFECPNMPPLIIALKRMRVTCIAAGFMCYAGELVEEIKSGEKFQMHEHINFFSEKSLRTLLEKNGFKVISFKDKIIRYGKYKFHDTLCALVQKNEIGQNWGGS